MNGLLSDPRFTLAVVAVLMALLGWLGRGYVRRLEDLEDAAIKQKDLDALQKDFDDKHLENRQRGVSTDRKLESIESGIRETHSRIDDLYRDLINRN